jgi:alpha-D-ribose 1-methylphosphonate 5-triphosphate synthase subunit PhnH
VAEAQASFRAILDALARPGRVQRLGAGLRPPAPLQPAAAAALLTLADAETPLWTDATGEARDWIAFHTGAPFVPLAQAQFAMALGPMPLLAALNPGSDETPQESATLILQLASFDDSSGWRLTGPGIEHEHRLAAPGLPADFPAQWAANRAQFPRGVDLILCSGSRLAALPRTTRITEER